MMRAITPGASEALLRNSPSLASIVKPRPSTHASTSTAMHLHETGATAALEDDTTQSSAFRPM
jgi:hypothetical protein